MNKFISAISLSGVALLTFTGTVSADTLNPAKSAEMMKLLKSLKVPFTQGPDDAGLQKITEVECNSYSTGSATLSFNCTYSEQATFKPKKIKTIQDQFAKQLSNLITSNTTIHTTPTPGTIEGGSSFKNVTVSCKTIRNRKQCTITGPKLAAKPLNEASSTQMIALLQAAGISLNLHMTDNEQYIASDVNCTRSASGVSNSSLNQLSATEINELIDLLIEANIPSQTNADGSIEFNLPKIQCDQSVGWGPAAPRCKVFYLSI